MSDIDINQLLTQMRSLRTQMVMPQAQGAIAANQEAPDFANLLKQSVDKVNQMQSNSDKLAGAFEAGAPGVDLAQVMVEMQKAGLSFRALSEVRNHLVSAYQEVMRMSILKNPLMMKEHGIYG